MFQGHLFSTLSICFLWKDIMSCDVNKLPAARLPGDFMIGGIFILHDRFANLSNRTYSDDLTCNRLTIDGMIHALAMIYTIDQLNNMNFLPGITFGYEIYDSCSDILKATQATLRLFPEIVQLKNSTDCNHTEIIPSVKALIGAQYADISAAISRLLSVHFIPQISPASSEEALSDKLNFPSFLRTVPSDTHLMQAIVKLIKTFEWNFVGIISSDDDHGLSVLHLLNKYFEQQQICAAFTKIVSSFDDDPSLHEELDDILNTIINSSTNVVFVFAKYSIVKKLFEKAIIRNISRTWVSGGTWINSRETSNIANIEKVGTVLGFSVHVGVIPGFSEYLQNLKPPVNGSTNLFLEEYKELRFGCDEKYKNYMACINSSRECRQYVPVVEKSTLACRLDNVSYTNDDYLVDLFQWQTAYTTVLAVSAIAQAFKNIVWKHGTLAKDLMVTPRQVPFSNCTKPCSPGHFRSLSSQSCCYECIPCPEGYYTSAPDMDDCSKCANTTWSKSGSAHCEDRKIEYLEWENPLAVAVMVLASLGFLLLLITGTLFIKYNQTPAVKAAGGRYSYVMIISLLLSLTSLCFFIGKPNDTICQIRQPLYGISFTICVCCILVKSLRIILAFKFAIRFVHLPKIVYKPIIIIIVLTGVQICICTLWLILKRPTCKEIYTIPKVLVLQCDEGSYVPFGVMLGYIACLALACFILAYKGRKLPEKYNEASTITFSMLIYMFVWIIFIPVFMNTGNTYHSAVQSVAILASVYGVIFCHLLPTSYIILFKRRSNNRQRYLQTIRSYCGVTRATFPLTQKKFNIYGTQTNFNAGPEVKNFPQSKAKSMHNFSPGRKRRKSF
uniref:G-protein coupled receptors family 3 profile domain-containing protein n=1 Tax=Leptobrachium leishanense TaxID=445787 RepID=A0A8C5PI94_9ANUR